MTNSSTAMPEPDSYLFQHEETGLIQCVDSQQVEWGFEKINPRWHRIGGMITTTQAEAYKDACVQEALEQAAEIADKHNDFATYDAILALIK